MGIRDRPTAPRSPWQNAYAERRATAVVAHATNLEEPRIQEILDGAELIVDVTTTLGFPRTIAARDDVKRALSIFLTPTGHSAAMLVEDAARTLRLDALEAQYYRHVISESWGANHLAENRGQLWTGAGCRDLSTVIPNELIALHGANLARMVRLRSRPPEASLTGWTYDPADGSLTASNCTTAASPFSPALRLRIVWDEAIRSKVRDERARHLPNETGGVH